MILVDESRRGSKVRFTSSCPRVILVDQPGDGPAFADISDLYHFGIDTDGIGGGKVDPAVRPMRVVVLFEPGQEPIEVTPSRG